MFSKYVLLTLPRPPLQLVLELLEVEELELARGILRSTPAMLAMKQVSLTPDNPFIR